MVVITDTEVKISFMLSLEVTSLSVYTRLQVQYSTAMAVPCSPDQRGPNLNSLTLENAVLNNGCCCSIAGRAQSILATPVHVPCKDLCLSLYPFQMHSAHLLCKVSNPWPALVVLRPG